LQQVAEAEYGGAFHAARRAVPLRNIFKMLCRCPQPTTDVITDNAVAGIATDTIKAETFTFSGHSLSLAA
jgi:hypothetical protein